MMGPGLPNLLKMRVGEVVSGCVPCGMCSLAPREIVTPGHCVEVSMNGGTPLSLDGFWMGKSQSKMDDN